MAETPEPSPAESSAVSTGSATSAVTGPADVVTVATPEGVYVSDSSGARPPGPTTVAVAPDATASVVVARSGTASAGQARSVRHPFVGSGGAGVPVSAASSVPSVVPSAAVPDAGSDEVPDDGSGVPSGSARPACANAATSGS